MMIDLFSESRKGKTPVFDEPILYRPITQKKKDGTMKHNHLRLELSTQVLTELGWNHKDKIVIRTDTKNFELEKVEKNGFALCYARKNRAILVFSFKVLLPKNKQEIKDYKIEKGVLKFQIEPVEIIIPKED